MAGPWGVLGIAVPDRPTAGSPCSLCRDNGRHLSHDSYARGLGCITSRVRTNCCPPGGRCGQAAHVPGSRENDFMCESCPGHRAQPPPPRKPWPLLPLSRPTEQPAGGSTRCVRGRPGKTSRRQCCIFLLTWLDTLGTALVFWEEGLTGGLCTGNVQEAALLLVLPTSCAFQRGNHGTPGPKPSCRAVALAWGCHCAVSGDFLDWQLGEWEGGGRRVAPF